jgi:hypothetical protein
MNDTLWIAQSKAELELITQTATSFYQMANIQINSSKSILTSNSTPTSMVFSNSQLQSTPSNQPFKFLGCWFILDNKQTQQHKIIYN